MDETAFNYNSEANTDDGSCVAVINGCTDAAAFNYNSEANTDDGSCVAEPTPGTACSYTTTSEGFMPVSCPSSSCNDSACSYQPMLGYVCFPTITTTVSGIYDCDGNCIPDQGSNLDFSPCSGCTLLDNSAFNYDQGALIDDGSCIALVEGCMDETAFNYNSEANTDDGSCVAVINGCTDAAAFNYNSEANTDDGSCVAEPTPGTACSYTTTSEGFMPVSCPSSSCNDSACSYQPMLGYVCFPTITTTVSGIYDCDGNCIPDQGSNLDFSPCSGCTDNSAFNYDQGALIDDGSCIALVEGCMDETAFNYNSEANTDDGSCVAVINGCTDAAAFNYNSEANTDDGSCVAEPTPGTACSYTTTSEGFMPVSCPSSSCNDSACSYQPMLGYVCFPTITTTVSGIYDCDGNCIPDQGSNLDFSPCSGCTDNNAFNYDQGALIDDGSCLSVVNGCTDATAFNYNSEANTDDGSCEFVQAADAAPLFFSEYAEGSSNNKYLEIFNPTSETVDLSNYAYPSVSNAPTTPGIHEYWNTFDEGASIAPGDVYVVAHPSSDPLILEKADETHSYLSNGDDGYALAFGTEESHVIIDMIGDFMADPGSGWSVAGVSNATKDHTLLRKMSVTSGNTDWALSAGTSSDDSEWIVFNQNTWDYLGFHSELQISIVGCTDPEAYNYNDQATEDDGSCVAVVDGCTDQSMSNYNSEANTDDGSCVSWEELANNLQSELDNVVPEDGVSQEDVDAAYTAGAASVTPEDGITQSDVDAAFADGVASVEVPECEEVATQNMPLDLPQGWSMFGYTCLESLDVVEAFSGVSDNIEIVKDEWGLAYLPAWGFSAFDNLEFGEGYQIKMIEELTDFQFCSTVTGNNTDGSGVNFPIGWASWAPHSAYDFNNNTGVWEENFNYPVVFYFSETHIHFHRDMVIPYQLVEPNEIIIPDLADDGDLHWFFTTGTQHIITGEEGEFLFILETDETGSYSTYWIYTRP